MKPNTDYRFHSSVYQSIDCITIQLVDNDRLDDIDERVRKYSRHFHSAPEFQIKRNDIVVAVYAAWNKWFRACVLSCNENTKLVELYAIDYECNIELPKHCVFPLIDRALAQMKVAQPIKVGIYGIAPTDGSDFEVKKIFEIFIKYSPFNIFRCLKVQDGRCFGEIRSSNHKSFSDLIVDFEWAVRTKDDLCVDSEMDRSDKHISNSDSSENDAVSTIESAQVSTANEKLKEIASERELVVSDEQLPEPLVEIGTDFTMSTIFCSMKLDDSPSEAIAVDGDRTMAKERNEARDETLSVAQLIEDEPNIENGPTNYKNQSSSGHSSQSTLIGDEIETSQNVSSRELLETFLEDVKRSTEQRFNRNGAAYSMANWEKNVAENPSQMTPNGIIASMNESEDPQELHEHLLRDKFRDDDSQVFDFDSFSEDSESICLDPITFAQLMRKQKLEQVRQHELSNDIVPLKDLSLQSTQILCIGDTAADLNPSICGEHFLSPILEQLEGLQKTYHLQELVWPHLLKGKSAIIIEPSDNVADLVYLPDICTHANKIRNHKNRNGPLAIIICKTQNRCIEIAKRCLSFSAGVYMAARTICHPSDETNSFVPHEIFENCRIFVTTITFIRLFGKTRLKNCNAVEQIVFDGTGEKKQLHDIINAMESVPKQIIITSKFWTPDLTDIYYNSNRADTEYLIFGSPLDIAIAANTAFDVIFVSKTKISSAKSNEHKLYAILDKVKTTQLGVFVIVCFQLKDINKIKSVLKKANLRWYTCEENDGLYKIEYAGKEVYFCVSRVLEAIDLSNYSYFFTYNCFAKARFERDMLPMANKFRSIIKSNVRRSEPPHALTIALFCVEVDTKLTAEMVDYFFDYQRAMRCPAFWSFVSKYNNIYRFAHNLCLEFGEYNNVRHSVWCDKRHYLDLNLDAPQLYEVRCQYWIKFKILHFYSPIHFQVEISAQSSNGIKRWMDLNSNARITEVYLATRMHDKERCQIKNIYDRMENRKIISECYEGIVYMELKNIFFLETMQGCMPKGIASLADDLNEFLKHSNATKMKLSELFHRDRPKFFKHNRVRVAR